MPLTIPQIMTYGRHMYFGIKTTEKRLVKYAKKFNIQLRTRTRLI